jgi:hypothetical protein
MKLQENDIKLNLQKCVFGVPRGIISECGIEANPEKVTAITRMGLIQNIKGYSQSWDASQLSAASYHASVNEAFLSTAF